MFCTQCGTQLPDGSNFCHVCGARYDVQQPYVNNIKPNYKHIKQNSLKKDVRYGNTSYSGNMKGWLIGGSIAAVFLVVLIVVLIVINPFDNKRKKISDMDDKKIDSAVGYITKEDNEQKNGYDLEEKNTATEETAFEEKITTEKETTEDTAESDNNIIFSILSEKKFSVIASTYALEWSDEVSVNKDGSIEGRCESYGETVTVTEYTGYFKDPVKISETEYKVTVGDTEIKPGSSTTPGGASSFWYNEGEVYVYLEGCPIGSVKDHVIDILNINLYNDITSESFIPCDIIYNVNDNSVYADSEYISNRKKASEDDSAFYGVWCYGSKNEADANSFASDLSGVGFDAKVYVTTDWENLNTELYYVVTAGVCLTEDEANYLLESVKKAGYTDAYVKYTGNRR